MTVFDEAIVAGPAAAEGICVSCPFREAGPRVLGLEYARERARAEAAEARCEELRRAEVEARSVAGSLKWRLDKCRGELKAAGDEVKSVRRMAKNALALQAEVSRLEKLLSQAGVESGKRSTIMSLREENARLKKDVRAAKDRVGRIKLLERETGDLRFWLRGSHERLERIEARHRDEVDWLNKDIACLRSALGRSVDKRNGEMASLRKQFERRHAATVRKVAARDRTIAWLRERNDRLRGHVRLARWCEGWIERTAEIYRLNEARLAHYGPGLERRTPAFETAQSDLREAVDGLFADAEAELAGLSAEALRAKPLRSLLNHREGLCVFVDRPQVPMDNNKAERVLRGPSIGRRLSFGSDSEAGAKFTAIMYSVAGTLALNGIDVRRWLQAWLTACANNGGKPPDDLSPWLPWSMSAERRRERAAPS